VSYLPRSSLQVVCSPPCAIAHAEKARQKREKCEQKAVRKVDREKKTALKTRSQWMKEAQQAINKYVRWRDYHLPCVSCGAEYSENKLGGVFDSGHYRSTGSAPHLRFNLHNISKQCVKCNRYLSSNAVNYRLNLIIRIGLDKVEALESNNASRHFNIDYLERIKKIFNKKSRILEKRILNGDWSKVW
jgi:hypothetical protein